MSPVYVLLISVIFFKQKARGKDILVVIFSILGVALFFIDKVAAGSLLGNILGICGGILFALSFIYNNRAKVNPLHLSLIHISSTGTAFSLRWTPSWKT